MSLRYPARFKPSTSLGRFSVKTGCGAAGGGVTRVSGGAEGASVGLADSVVVGGFFLHAAKGSVAATRKTTAMARDQFLFIPVSFSLSGRAIQRARAKKHAIQRARAKKHSKGGGSLRCDGAHGSQAGCMLALPPSVSCRLFFPSVASIV